MAAKGWGHMDSYMGDEMEKHGSKQIQNDECITKDLRTQD